MNRRIALFLIASIMFLSLYLKSRHNGIHSGKTALPASELPVEVVQVSGDLIHPGIYEISANDLTINVIKMAIPLCPEQLNNLNPRLLPPLQPGYRYDIACKHTQKRPLVALNKIPPAQALTLGIPLDLNQIKEAELELLPGIGPEIAKRITEYRQKYGDFKTKKELLLINGIGDKKYKNISRFFNSPE